MYKSLINKFLDIVGKAILILISYYLFLEILTLSNLGALHKWYNGWSIDNINDNFSTILPSITASIAIAILHELIFTQPAIDSNIVRFKQWLAKLINSPNLIYDSILNTSTIHTQHLDDFINSFFSTSVGKIHLYNPDPAMFAANSAVLAVILKQIRKGKIKHLHISCGDQNEFDHLVSQIAALNKTNTLQFSNTSINSSTPRFAAYYETAKNNEKKQDLSFFMWRPRIAPQKDNLVHILRSNYFDKLAHETSYDFQDEVKKLLAACEGCNDFDLSVYSAR